MKGCVRCMCFLHVFIYSASDASELMLEVVALWARSAVGREYALDLCVWNYISKFFVYENRYANPIWPVHKQNKHFVLQSQSRSPFEKWMDDISRIASFEGFSDTISRPLRIILKAPLDVQSISMSRSATLNSNLCIQRDREYGRLYFEG